jgi:hypothetical protein
VAKELTGPGLTPVVRHVEAPVDAVWAVLADGWLYANWVVGASRVREVDETWPAVGSALAHSFGIWPAVVNDESRVLESEPGVRLSIQAKGWPMGEARVDLRLDAWADETCDVTLVEDAIAGPGSLVPRVIRQPLIAARNKEALRRLALIAEGRHREWTNRAG